ncbi:hypothetical protein [Polyangium sp. y55x31]|uniref:hypothetical protein n=1 Tax=Polyangium sp. y55x31 TaxID=3042688 RepID=UPI0024830F94|nr:hypothetical protein [Polyangium sp. y55x31]MDI1480397.1 hypothetical protein [Polyangium sp. y55x31]
MSDLMICIDDKRGLLFTINGESNPVYQVESKSWAQPDNRWSEKDIPQAIRDKIARLEASGKPGAFVRFLQGEDGVYVICEKNIKNLPESADEDVVLDPLQFCGDGRTLSTYDLIIHAKGGKVEGDNGEAFETKEGEYYVIRCQSWSRVVLDQPMRPHFVETTKEFLRLLEDLHGKNYLSMSPDKPEEVLPPDIAAPTYAIEAINCYVLNLSRFRR